MAMLMKVLIALAALALVLAIVGALFTGPIYNIPPESWSRACSNLALLAIALALVFKEERTPG